MPYRVSFDDWLLVYDAYDSLEALLDQLLVVDQNVADMAARGIETHIKEALLAAIAKRRLNGERVTRARPSRILTDEHGDDEADRVVEVIKCGGKGQTVRIVHPRV